MYTFITVLIFITCILLALVVLVQNSKGGGLASGFSASTQLMGVRKTGDFLEKLTWGLAIALIFFCLISNFALPDADSKGGTSVVKEELDNNAGSANSGKAKLPNAVPPAAPAAPNAPAAPQK